MPYGKAYEEITRCQGAQFCPEVVETFIIAINEETFMQAHQMTRLEGGLLEVVPTTILQEVKG